MWFTTKLVFWFTVSGFTAGALSVHYAEAEHLKSIASRKFCGAYDVDRNFHWENCVDQGYADAIAKASMDADSASVFDAMAQTQPKKRRKP